MNSGFKTMNQLPCKRVTVVVANKLGRYSPSLHTIHNQPKCYSSSTKKATVDRHVPFLQRRRKATGTWLHGWYSWLMTCGSEQLCSRSSELCACQNESTHSDRDPLPAMISPTAQDTWLNLAQPVGATKHDYSKSASSHIQMPLYVCSPVTGGHSECSKWHTYIYSTYISA